MSEPIVNWLTDMDGVLVHEEHALPGAAQFIATLRERGIPFQILTNNSIFTPRDLAARLRLSGIEVVESDLWTSALATAKFLADQIPSDRKSTRLNSKSRGHLVCRLLLEK